MFHRYKTSSRSAALSQVAAELDMKFLKQDEWGIRNLMKDFKLFQRGSRRRVTNIIHHTSGLLDEKLNICDYQYTIRTNRSAKTFNQTVFFLQSKEMGLPEMLLRPENLFHKIGSYFGMQDIDFEEWPEFSKRFLVQGDEWGVRRLLNEEITHFFLVEKHWCLESVGYFLVFYRRNWLVAPQHIKVLYDKGMALVGHLKVNDYL